MNDAFALGFGTAAVFRILERIQVIGPAGL